MLNKVVIFRGFLPTKSIVIASQH